MFAKGPEAVEFLGQKVDEPWALGDTAGGAPQGAPARGGGGGEGGGGGWGKPIRYYSRAAIVCWPRSKRCAPEAEKGGRGGICAKGKMRCVHVHGGVGCRVKKKGGMC